MDTTLATMFNIMGKDYMQGFLLGFALGGSLALIVMLYIYFKHVDKKLSKYFNDDKESLINQHNKDMDRMLQILNIADTKKGEKALSDTLEAVWDK